MFTIRRFEEEAARAYSQGKIGGFLHLYIGQEPIAVGACAALPARRLRADDLPRPRPRPRAWHDREDRDGRALRQGHRLLEGARRLDALLRRRAQHARRLRDRRRSHPDRRRHRLRVEVPRGEDKVSMVFFGEGAVSIGDFHEGMSLAALFKLPIVFVCENNEYSMGTPLARTMSVEDVSQKALGYGMARDRFFADHVFTVKDRLADAIERARLHSEPTLVEIRTYRFRGHSMSDPGKYPHLRGARRAQEEGRAPPQQARARGREQGGRRGDRERGRSGHRRRDQVRRGVARARPRDPRDHHLRGSVSRDERESATARPCAPR